MPTIESNKPNPTKQNPAKQNPIKDKNFKFKTFFKIISLLLLVVLTGTVMFAYSLFKDDRNTTIDVNLSSNLKKDNIITSFFTPVEKRINFVIMGVDSDSTRTDFMMVGCFNTKDKKIDLISIPRDTYVEMPEERLDILKAEERTVPPHTYLKLNEVHSYAGEDYGVSFTVKQIEELLGIELHYYIKIDLEAFRYLVDEIGGVDFYVPQRMLYSDPTQDLTIDLMEGQQILNGKNAEGLIRYRKSTDDSSPSYALGDLKRVEVQQEFLKALISQALSKDNFIKNVDAMVNTSYKYLNTNFSASEIPKYLKYAQGLSADSITTHTMPWYIKEMPDTGLSFVGTDKKLTNELIASIFYDEEDGVSSKNMIIEILNGGYTKGLAANKKVLLEEEGFSVLKTGDYTENKKNETIILVKENGMAKDIVKFFKSPTITVDDTLNDSDIVVILGIDES